MTVYFRTFFGGLIIALVGAVFAISFAAIVYKDELTPYISSGIGLTLMGSVVLAFLGPYVLSYRGAVLAPQDVPAILLAGAVATLVGVHGLSTDVLFSTIVCLTILASFLTGFSAVIVGQFKLAYISRFVPYPVLAGFLAATGLLLFLGGISVAVGNASVNIKHWSDYFTQDILFKWVPICFAAIAIVFATRKFSGPFTLPITLSIVCGGFYLLFWSVGISIDRAQQEGILLGPFPEDGFFGEIGFQIFAQADWWAILSQAPVILTIIAVTLIGTTLNASGLELEFQKDFDINQEVKGSGVANMAASFVGGLPGYHLLGETMLANRLGLTGRSAGLSSGLGCLGILLFGASILSLLPVGLFASVIAYLGLDLLYTWLWTERRKLRFLDYMIVVLIPVTAVTFSFLTAIAVGLMVACAFFVVTYAKLEIIRSRNNLSARRSYVERPERDVKILSEHGDQAQIVELTGFLFFGSSNVLRDKIKVIIGEDYPKIRWLVVDFKHVVGIDVSTSRIIQRMVTDCKQHNVRLLLSSLSTHAETELKGVLVDQNVDFFPTLDTGIEHVEDALIAENNAQNEDHNDNILSDIQAIIQKRQMDKYTQRINLKSGEILLEQNVQSKDIYILLSGQLDVIVTNKKGEKSVVSQVRSGSVIGELAYYSDQGRSADIIASSPSELLKIKMDMMGEMEKNKPDSALKFHKLIARNMALRLNRTTMLLRNLGM